MIIPKFRHGMTQKCMQIGANAHFSRIASNAARSESFIYQSNT